jgi:hypothetical protein
VRGNRFLKAGEEDLLATFHLLQPNGVFIDLLLKLLFENTLIGLKRLERAVDLRLRALEGETAASF